MHAYSEVGPGDFNETYSKIIVNKLAALGTANLKAALSDSYVHYEHYEHLYAAQRTYEHYVKLKAALTFTYIYSSYNSTKLFAYLTFSINWLFMWVA